MRGASIGILIILAVIGTVISGCTGKNEASSAYAENQNGAITDPHVQPATFGGYNIKGDVEGYGFKAVNPNGMGITPGGKAEIVGIIENGKGIVYMDREATEGADVGVAKGGIGVGEWNIFPSETPGKDGLFKFELNLDELKEKYGLGPGDAIGVSNFQGKNKVRMKFILQ